MRAGAQVASGIGYDLQSEAAPQASKTARTEPPQRRGTPVTGERDAP